MFRELAQGRTGNGFGPNPIGWTEMRDWSILTATTLSPLDVEVLRGLDGLYLMAYANRPKQEAQNG
jgi:hypothetical protein